MPTSVAQPRKRTLPGLWALIGAVVVIIAVMSLVAVVAKILFIVIVWVAAGTLASMLGSWAQGTSVW
jgi:HJR/Mrr/RecB family endonuclease